MAYTNRCKPENYEFYDNDDWLYEDGSEENIEDYDIEDEEDEEGETMWQIWSSRSFVEPAVKSRWDYVFDSIRNGAENEA